MKFSGNMSSDNINSHKKPGFLPLSRKYIFQETTGVGSNWPPLPSRFRVNKITLANKKP